MITSSSSWVGAEPMTSNAALTGDDSEDDSSEDEGDSERGS